MKWFSHRLRRIKQYKKPQRILTKPGNPNKYTSFQLTLFSGSLFKKQTKKPQSYPPPPIIYISGILFPPQKTTPYWLQATSKIRYLHFWPHPTWAHQPWHLKPRALLEGEGWPPSAWAISVRLRMVLVPAVLFPKCNKCYWQQQAMWEASKYFRKLHNSGRCPRQFTYWCLP